MTKKTNLKEVFFEKLWALVSKRPVLVVLVAALLAIASGVCSALFLKLDSNQDHLVSENVPFHKRYLQSIKNFGDQEYFFVVIKTGGTEQGKARAVDFAGFLEKKLLRKKSLVRSVYYKMDAKDFGDKALYMAPMADTRKLCTIIHTLAPSIQDYEHDPSLATLMGSLAGLMNAPPADMAGAGEGLISGFPAINKILDNMDLALRDQKTSPEILPKAEETTYFFTKNGKLLIMRIMPSKDFSTMDVVGNSLAWTRECLNKARAEFPKVEAGLTGRPVLSADEMKTTDKDMTRASLIAVALVGLLFMIVLHGWVRPGLTILSLGMAISWTFGFAWLVVGRLNLLSIVFALVLVGIGVDFGIHIVLRTLEAGRRGLPPVASIQRALYCSGPGVVLGALTSVCAFFSVMGSDFLGLAELGIIGGMGILLCLIAMLLVLPALLVLASGTKAFKHATPRLITMPFMDKLTDSPKIVLGLVAVATILALPYALKTGFSYNMLELQAKGLESVEYELEIIRESDESTWYAIAMAANMEQLKELTKKYKALPTVGTVDSILNVFPSGQEEKQALFQKAYAAIKGQRALGPEKIDPDKLTQALDQLELGYENVQEKLFSAGAGKEAQVMSKGLDAIDAILDILEENPQAAQKLLPLQNQVAGEIFKSLDRLESMLRAGPMEIKELPAFLRSMYIGRDGRLQLKVTPKTNVWDFEELDKFVTQLRSVDKNIGGVPVGVLESARLMHSTFLTAALVTLALVGAILWLNSLSLSSVLLTMTPLALGMIWLVELMGLTGLSFNLANFFAIPVLIAIGVDGGVHFLSRWKNLDNGETLFTTSTPTAVILSFATTMIGFGGLLIAHHRGLASLGAIMVIGSATGMVASVVVLPCVLKLLRSNEDD